MGCDIHTSVQIRRDGQWQDAQDWHAPYGYPKPEGGEFIKQRNYSLFGILAGVRREVPAALAAGRGLPEGLSDAAAEFHEGNHSATHFTLAEVLAYDWTQIMSFKGWVDPFEWAKWRDQGKPRGWSGSVGGGSVRHLPREAFEAAWVRLRDEAGYPEVRHASAHLRPLSGHEHADLARFIELLGGGSPFTEVEWEEPYWAVAGDLFSSAVPRALALAAPDNVRFVVSFDS